MNKQIKKILAVIMVMIMTISFAVTTFAAKTVDTKTKYHSEFGTLTGYEEYLGKEGGRKTVTFSKIFLNYQALLLTLLCMPK